MGLISADLTLANPLKDELQPIMAKAVVDTGALFLCIPALLYSKNKISLRKNTILIILLFAGYLSLAHEKKEVKSIFPFSEINNNLQLLPH